MNEDDPLRVVMLINGYYPRIGGAERQLGALAPLLQAQGVEVHVLTRRYPGLASYEEIDGVPVHRLPIPALKPVASLSFTFKAMGLMRELRPHVIHAHDMFSCATTAVLMKQLSGIPVVVTIHGGGPGGDIGRLKEKSLGMQRLALFQNTVDSFVTISQEIDSGLAELGVPPEARIAIPNGVDTKRFAPLKELSKMPIKQVSMPQGHQKWLMPSAASPFSYAMSSALPLSIKQKPYASDAQPNLVPTSRSTPLQDAKKELRASLGLPPNGLITIFTGRLVPGKRVDQLVAIWPAVRAHHREAYLLVLGSGPEEEALKQAAGAGIIFAGRVEDVAPYLKASDLFILPSAAEGLSVALLEAMATGLPAISTNVGGAPDIIKHGKNGWLVPPDHPPALQTALLTLLGNTTLRTNMGQQARQQVVGRYSLPVVAARLRELYGTLR
jgi:glycosyltransferase involved in cell wall biosynthesis